MLVSSALSNQFIKSIYQAALKYYNARAGDDFRRVHMLLLAPTGKAAYFIKGNTIHVEVSRCLKKADYRYRLSTADICPLSAD